MRIIKVSATPSTNELARDWYGNNKASGPVVFVAGEQTAGKGQRGSSWVSNAGENLTMSIIYPSPGVEIQSQFLLSATVALAILEALTSLEIDKLKLKWPNDIMAANKKIGGILIENFLSGGSIAATVIGVGLNVNQLSFPGLPQAASLKKVSGKEFDLDEMLQTLVKRLVMHLDHIDPALEPDILRRYEQVLFRINKISTFQLKNGSLLTGIIKGVTSTGLLKVEVEDKKINLFDLKELKLLF